MIHSETASRRPGRLRAALSFTAARQVLQECGAAIRERDGVPAFLATQEIESGEVPLLVSGRALPEVPATHRTIFQLVPNRPKPSLWST